MRQNAILPARSTVYRFTRRDLALSFIACAVKPLRLVLGDHDGERGEYLVTTPADAERLARAGYSYA